MSQQLRQLKGRIRSVEGTWKVTRAMEMVAMAKFKAIGNPLAMGRSFLDKVNSLLASLACVEGDSGSPFLTPKNGKGPVGLFVFTADAGLCGVYNNRALAMAEDFIKKLAGRPVRIFVYGRKGQNYFKKRGIPVERTYPALHGRPVGNFHAGMLTPLIEAYEKEGLEEIYVVYSKFKNAMLNTTTLKKFLPIELPKGEKRDAAIESVTGEGLLPEIVPLFLSTQFRMMMLESLASENSSRMVSMRAAKDNAKELMGDLILLRNKMRQAMITKEVIEIISSAEALKG